MTLALSRASLLRPARSGPVRARAAPPARRTAVRVAAVGPDSKAPKKTLKREEEPEEYWQSKLERSGKSPLRDPAAIIGIIAIVFPFVILGIAFATGLIEVPER